MKPLLLLADHVTLRSGTPSKAIYPRTVSASTSWVSRWSRGPSDASYVPQNNVTFVLNTPYTQTSPLNDLLKKHGDGATDIAFAVDDAAKAWEHTTQHGAKNWFEPRTMEDEGGKVVVSGIHTYGDARTRSSSARRRSLPPRLRQDEIARVKSTGLFIDHIVGNQPDSEMENVVRFYENIFGFQRLWTVDDKDISTEHTALRSVVVADENENIKMPINERRGAEEVAIQEHVDFNSGAGIHT
jgi:4-hydroxyphenylpyruvate dioxygenase